MIDEPCASNLPEEYHAALRGDFHTFMMTLLRRTQLRRVVSAELALEVMAAKLQEVRDGRIRRLIVNIPPRHLKSLARRSRCRPGCSATIRPRPSSTSPTARTSRTSSPATAGRS